MYIEWKNTCLTIARDYTFSGENEEEMAHAENRIIRYHEDRYFEILGVRGLCF